MTRPNKDHYYLNIAKQVATRSTCLVSNYGCVIVKNDIIISTGYNGSPRGAINCSDTGVCQRDVDGTSRYNSCRAVHSEPNALIQARSDAAGSTMYISRSMATELSHIDVKPCHNCIRLIMNAQVKNVLCLQDGGAVMEWKVKHWIDEV